MLEAPVTSVRTDAELVRILVVDKKLKMPVEDHTIYYHDPARSEPATPGRPNEVVWLAWGLSPGQKVMIKAKTSSRNQGNMALDDHGPILTGSNPLYSGKTKGVGSSWLYDVVLLDEDGTQLDVIDPNVIIEPDP